MSKEKKVVALVRRHMEALEGCPLDGVESALANLEGTQVAAAAFGLEDLAHATICQNLIETPKGREAIMAHLDNPLKFYQSCQATVEQHKEHLR